MNSVRLCVCLLAFCVASVRAQQPRPGFEVYEVSIQELQSALSAGRVTSVQLVDAYLQRIAAFDQAGPKLNAMIRLNPKARADAAVLDAERRAGRVRGALHGIPIILKDNYETAGFATSGGSVALAGLVTDQDAFQVKKLRDAGAIILGKSNMHELAAGITTISSLGGQTRNPYDPMRNPGGSSGGSGVAAAASYAAIAWGSDTCGSIRIPSSVHNLFGLRPTKGLSSIDGIIPLSHTQDVAGPLARTVTDLAIGLDATIGADPKDEATQLMQGQSLPQFLASLDTTALRGKRLGVVEPYMGNQPEELEVGRVIRGALEHMKSQGAEVVEIPNAPFDSVAQRAGVIPFEFKWDLMDFLAARPTASVKSLSEILERGLYHVALENTFRTRDTISTRNGENYRRAIARRDSARSLVIELMNEHRLDALVYPTLRRKPALIGQPQPGATCQLSAVTGLPAISLPAGFTQDRLPIGIELLGKTLDDAKLVAMAYDYEQAAHPRRPPPTTPPLRRTTNLPTVSVTATGGSVRAVGRFAYDAASALLEYNVTVTGVPAADIHAITLTRGSVERPGATLIHLSGLGVANAKGTAVLGEAEQNAIVTGGLMLTIYTRTQPLGAARALMPPLK
jgi:Asp-tRNA(Asn)/Glu-tRNA(Gln) amidotransferase A subunit family amidase